MIGFNLFLVVVLIIATAFFVAAEFAFVKIRPSRIEQLVSEGNKSAGAVKKIINNLDGYLSACQLGITVTAIGLGALGEPTFAKLLQSTFTSFQFSPAVTATLSFLLAYSAMTFLHVVFGELAPKTVAIQKAEKISLLLAKPMIWFYKLMYPFIWLLNGSAALLVRMFGLKPAKEHEEAVSEEELRIILNESYKRGEINQAEYGYVSNIFTFDELLAREIMVPRLDMVCLYIDKSLEENLAIIKRDKFTRFPVVDQDKDNVIGMINTKQFFLQYADNPEIKLDQLIHPVLSVPETIPIKKLLVKMQKNRVHLAILFDEYGGTAGMITIEDILEEIVGDIRDEFDQEEVADIEQINEHHVIVDGKVLISEINSLFGNQIETVDYDTIGGWLYAQNSALNDKTEWQYNRLVFKVLKKDTHRYRKIEIRMANDPSA